MTRVLLAAAFVAALVLPTQAVVVAPITFEQLVADATTVVYARVSEVEGRWTADRRNIESVITLESLRYFKGNLGHELQMRLPGGEAGGFRTVIPGAPVVRQGDLVVLFLSAKGPALLTPVGFTQGVFRVAVDARSGEARVVPPLLKESAAGRIVRGAAERRGLSLDAFAAEVRAVMEAAR